MVGTFQIEGQEFIALNGGPVCKFTEAVSFVVNCETQEQVDHYWTKLTAGGGKEVECGWPHTCQRPKQANRYREREGNRGWII